MHFTKAIFLLAVSGGLFEGVVAAGGRGGGGFKGQGGNGGNNAGNALSTGTSGAAASASVASSNAAASASTGATSTSSTTANAETGDDGSLTLDDAAIQTASASIGAVNATAGEADSETSNDNFINSCAGKTLTNGQQITTGSCNGIPMGDIPATTAMVSTIIVSPKTGDTIAANTDFTFSAQTVNLNAGTFTNAKTTYYQAPQRLASNGAIIGHTHFTAQALDSLNPTQPPDANTFAFFKGVDDAGVNGLLSATVAGGLPAGTYRVCTMSSSANHQPVLMPIAQRGAQDDCTKFTVSDSATGSSTGSTAASASASTAASATAAAAGSSASTATTTTGGKGRGGKGKGGKSRLRFARRQWVS